MCLTWATLQRCAVVGVEHKCKAGSAPLLCTVNAVCCAATVGRHNSTALLVNTATSCKFLVLGVQNAPLLARRGQNLPPAQAGASGGVGKWRGGRRGGESAATAVKISKGRKACLWDGCLKENL